MLKPILRACFTGEPRVVLVFVCMCVQRRFGGGSREGEESPPLASDTQITSEAEEGVS